MSVNLPRLLALLPCEAIERDADHRFVTIRDPFNRLIITDAHVTKALAVYARYMMGPAGHVCSVTLVRMEDGVEILRYDHAFDPYPTDRMCQVGPPFLASFDRPGSYEIWLLVDGVVIGVAPMLVESMPSASLQAST